MKKNVLPTRLRKNKSIRNLVKETRVSPEEFVYPIFVHTGDDDEEIPSMPGQVRIALDHLEEHLTRIKGSGIHSVLVFGIPESKDSQGSQAYKADGIVQEAIKRIKEIDPDIYVITDICLCEYKSDGHCCFFNSDGTIDREKTLDVLAQTALSHVRVGADMVAPSDMMDGHIEKIREVLDQNGYESIPIMGYSAKYASSFYGPFRDAADSAPAFGNRKTYQMNPANIIEALKEIELDTNEGADIIMVKPALSYLDVISKAKERTLLPLAAYQVSGEYSMLKNAVDSGIMNESVIYEALLSIKRAGADIIISYFAPEVKKLIEAYQ